MGTEFGAGGVAERGTQRAQDRKKQEVEAELTKQKEGKAGDETEDENETAPDANEEEEEEGSPTVDNEDDSTADTEDMDEYELRDEMNAKGEEERWNLGPGLNNEEDDIEDSPPKPAPQTAAILSPKGSFQILRKLPHGLRCRRRVFPIRILRSHLQTEHEFQMGHV